MFKSKKGFTLIELLVVITIIGILATGAVAIYTTQIQKARDTTRINDVKALQAAVEQVYQDSTEYPHLNEFSTGGTNGINISTFMDGIPSDPKTSQPCNEAACDYVYAVNSDDNGIQFGEYELSTAFESDGNKITKAAGDSGGDNTRYEIGIDTGNNDSTDGATSGVGLTGSGCSLIGTSTATGTGKIKVATDGC